MLLVLTPNTNSKISQLARTAEVLGWKIYNSGWRIPQHLLKSPGAVYGEQYFCEVVAEQMKWKLLSNSIDWITKLPEKYTNRKIELTTLQIARGLTEKKFIIPADDKVFEEKIYDNGNDLPKSKALDNTPVLVSDILNFTSQYRCFIKDKKVVSSCCYYYKPAKFSEPQIDKEDNYSVNSDAVINYVNDFLSSKEENIECASSTVIDVVRFKKDTYTIMKSIPPWNSELYGCEIVGSLDAIKSSCLPENEG